MRKKIGVILKTVITIALICWIVYTFNLTRSIEILKKLSVFTIILVILVNTVLGVIAPVKWKILLPQYGFFKLWGLSYIATFYSVVLPGQLGGEISKIYILGKGKTDAQQIAASVFIDKLTGIIGLMIVGIIGLSITQRQLPLSLLTGFVSALIILIIILFSLRISFFYSSISKILTRVYERFHWLMWVLHQITGSMESWHQYSKKTGIILISIILGCLYQLAAIVTIIILANDIGINISFSDWCWILGILSVMLLLPFTIAGIGIREGTLIGILGWLAISSEKALALSISILGLQIFLAIIGGIMDLARVFKKNRV